MPLQTAFVTGGSGFVGRTLIPYLVERGIAVRALARSDGAAAAVEKLGARVVRGDIAARLPVDALRGADAAFHSAAFVKDWGDEREAFAANVEGTQHVLDAAREAGVPRFVHVSTEAVLLGGRKIHRADETWPRPPRPIGVYARTKSKAEERVEAASGPGFAAVIVRPRFIWGAGDTTLLPKLIEGARDGSLRWIGDGRYLTSTCHVRNVCEGMLRAAERGAPGGIYFLTDGEPVPFRDLIEKMLRGQGVTPPTGTVPHPVAKAFSWLTDTTARLLRLGRPTLPYMTFHLIGEQLTVTDTRARRELGYVGEMSMEQGLREMAGELRRLDGVGLPTDTPPATRPRR